MSASMLRQMLTDAAAFLKAERFQEAQDASRRRKDLKSKLEPLEKLVAILQRFPGAFVPALPLNNANKKVKPSQKWMAEVATTAMELKLLPKVRSQNHCRLLWLMDLKLLTC
ncbi:hypothetical protein BBJ28_00009048 [Nothophytophthora sp. Chile5]|nr:hypothetical protein BBJ28_00009048 [Nothophytophthora sp. Chile5]